MAKVAARPAAGGLLAGGQLTPVRVRSRRGVWCRQAATVVGAGQHLQTQWAVISRWQPVKQPGGSAQTGGPLRWQSVTCHESKECSGRAIARQQAYTGPKGMFRKLGHCLKEPLGRQRTQSGSFNPEICAGEFQQSGAVNLILIPVGLLARDQVSNEIRTRMPSIAASCAVERVSRPRQARVLTSTSTSRDFHRHTSSSSRGVSSAAAWSSSSEGSNDTGGVFLRGFNQNVHVLGCPHQAVRCRPELQQQIPGPVTVEQLVNAAVDLGPACSCQRRGLMLPPFRVLFPGAEDKAARLGIGFKRSACR